MAGTPGRKPSPFTPIFASLRAEVESVEIPEQPANGGADPAKARAYWAGVRDTWRGWNTDRDRAGTLGWDGTLAASLADAFTSDNPEEAIAALYVLAAETVTAIASLERQR